MATSTFGTNTTSSLTAITYSNVGAGISSADLAVITQGIKNDKINGLPVLKGAFSRSGLLTIPNRGTIKVFAGDVVAIDSQGWPILVSAYSVAHGPWTLV